VADAGFFKGFNVNYWCYRDDCVKILRDIEDLENTGANLIKINIYGGTINWRSPYGAIPENQEALETMVEYCREVNIYYLIDVRAGPGHKDVSDGNYDTIWKNTEEKQMYTEMLKNYVIEYGNDPLFVGLNLMVETNPFWHEIENDDIESPLELKIELQAQNIDANKMFEYLIREIRTVNTILPRIVQNVSYSDPEWWA